MTSATFKLLVGLRRIAQIVVVIVGSTFFVSLLLQLLPVGLEELYVFALTEEGRQEQIRLLHLDANPVMFYLYWLGDFVRGDFGSYVYPTGVLDPVAPRLGAALPISLRLVVYVQIVALAISIPLGIFTAYRSGRRSDKVISYGLFTAASIPNFVFALLLASFLGVSLAWFPPLGYTSPGDNFVEHLRSMALPVMALAIPTVATYTRLLRTDVIATLREDYVTMAASKGLSNSRILFTHVLRPSSVTLFTSAALNMGALIGGTLVIEQIFSIPGLGSEIGLAIFSRQYFALQSYVAIIAIGYVVFNGIVDVAVGFVDPRSRERTNA
jgi:peptide/nickel transport system permease protein